MDDERNEHPHDETWNRAIFMLQRNRRQMIGFLLLCVVGGIIYYVASKPKAPKTAGTWKSRFGGMISSDEDSLNNRSAEGAALEARGSEASDLGSGESGSTDSKAGVSDTSSGSASRDAEPTVDILETGTELELLEELIALEDAKQNALEAQFISSQRRVKIANRLLEMDISEDNKIYLIISLIGAAYECDAINMKIELGVGQVRDEFIRVRDSFCEHPNAVIGSKASIGFPLVHIHDYFQNKDQFELKKAADQFDLHGDKILRDAATVRFFAQFIVSKFRDSDHSDEFRELTARIASRMANCEDENIRKIAMGLRENLFFSEADLGSLVDRIQGGNEVARADVQALFEGLEASPTSSYFVYDVAAKVIAKYHELGEIEESDTLLKRYLLINEKNESPEIRKAVLKAVANFEKSKKSKN